jgi:hypothetical protein
MVFASAQGESGIQRIVESRSFPKAEGLRLDPILYLFYHSGVEAVSRAKGAARANSQGDSGVIEVVDDRIN